MTPRIAVVQHGDYREALEIIGAGRNEPYFGMANSLEVLGDLLDDWPHLVVSLNAPHYSGRRGLGELVGLPCPALPRVMPGALAMLLWAERVRARLRAFRPTHVLLRCGGLLAEHVLRLCRRERYDTLVLFANYLPDERLRQRLQNRRMVELLNDPCVYRVGNHLWPATQSALDFGLDPAKAVAYDLPGQKQPADYAPKQLAGPPFAIVYAGSVVAAKGVGDLVAAVTRLHAERFPVGLTVLGYGPDLARLRERSRPLPDGVVRFAGRVTNDEVFAHFRGAALVSVPSRHEFTEGMPLTLTEALASRTPVIASDHPVLARTFREGEGLRFFRASNAASLAEVMRSALTDPVQYAHLSRTTADAHKRVTYTCTFNEIIQQWAARFTPPPGHPQGRHRGPAPACFHPGA